MSFVHASRRELRGFTLIELLVVIAIIAILAGLLLPSLATAKSRAIEMTCVNNLHEIGIAIRMFQDDHETRYPEALVMDLDPVTGLKAIKDTRWTLGGRDPKNNDHFNRAYVSAANRPLYPYIQAAETFHCPKDKGVAVQNCSCPNMAETKWDALGCSYHYNAGNLTKLAEPPTKLPQADPGKGIAGKPEGWPNSPSRYILVHEPPARPWGCSDRSPVWEQWHRSTGRTEFLDPALAPPRFISPVLFVDTHVAVHNFTKALTEDPVHPYEPTKDWVWYRPADGAL